jgi:phosphotransferase system enzyme I (PtsI)
MAGDPQLTRLLLGMGLRQFSMHPAQILEVKQEVMRSNLAELRRKASRLLATDDPAKLRQQLARLNTP